jgi:hypothetical protein
MAIGVITDHPFRIMLGAVLLVQGYLQTLDDPPSRWWYAVSAGLAVIGAGAIAVRLHGTYAATAPCCIGAAGGLAIAVVFNTAMKGPR